MILHALLFFFLLTNQAFLFKMNIVQIGGIRMNTVVTSKEIILEASKKLIREEGLNSINIRSVASACGVSVGSIYNYFDSKSELVAGRKYLERDFPQFRSTVCMLLFRGIYRVAV